MNRAINLHRMKQANKRMLLETLWRSSSTRVELAEQLHLTRASITMLIDEMISEGLIREAEVINSGVGRHPVMLQVVMNSRAIAGINIKRHRIEIGYADLAGNILCEERIPQIDEPPVQTLGKIAGILRNLKQSAGITDDEVLGVGICSPGPLQSSQGVILNPPNFSSWHNVPVVGPLQDDLKLPVTLMNISDALVLEEKYYGGSKEEANLLVMQVDEGIGSGIMIQNRLFRSFNGLGGVLGHTSIEMDGRQCICGNRGCLEAYASIPAILANSGFHTWREVIDAYPDSEAAKTLVDREAQYLAVSIVNSMNLFDLNRVVINGELEYGHKYLDERFEKLVWPRMIMRGYGDDRRIVYKNSGSYIRTGAIAFLYSYFHEYAFH